MPELSMYQYNPENIQIIDKQEYYKIKYVGTHTFLNLLVYVPHIRATLDMEIGVMYLWIQDPESSKLIQETETHLSRILPNYQRFSEVNGIHTKITFNVNRYVSDFYNRGQTRAHLRFKCIRKNSNDNYQVLLYIA